MGYLYGSDLDRIQLPFLKEAAKLRGTTVLFFQTLSETKNIYTDIEVQALEDPLSVDIIFQQYPQNRKTLEKAGWYNKDAEDNPDTAFVPLDLEILKRWQFVLLPGKICTNLSGDIEAGSWRKYHITKMQTTMEHPHFYLVAMAPVFTDAAPVIDRTKNSNFVDFSKGEEP